MSEYKEFNELPFETRKMICHYSDLFEIQRIEQILVIYKDDITPRLKKKLKEFCKHSRKTLNE